MVQKRETKAINKLCVREVLSLSFVCGAYFFEFRGRNLVCFIIAYNFNGKYAPEAGKTSMRTAFFTRVLMPSITPLPGTPTPGLIAQLVEHWTAVREVEHPRRPRGS